MNVARPGGTLVIGPKKLDTIRQELRRALAATGDDPIQWLEEQMSTSGPQGPAASESNEVLRSLRDFLEGTGRKKGRKTRAGTKK
jgi:hypothetical protein